MLWFAAAFRTNRDPGCLLTEGYTFGIPVL